MGRGPVSSPDGGVRNAEPHGEPHRSHRLQQPFGEAHAPLNLFYNYHPALDGATFLLALVVVAYALTRKKLVFAEYAIVPLLTLSAVYLALPNVMLASHGADRRLPLAVALLFIASTEWRLGSGGGKMALAAALGGFFLVRMGAIAAAWLAANPLYAQYFAAFDRLPEGARLAVATAHKWSETTVHPPVHSIAAMAAIRRSAFVPTLFADPREEALAFTPEYQRLAEVAPARVYFRASLDEMKIPGKRDAMNPFRADRLAGFQYLLAINPQDFPVAAPQGATPIFKGWNFVLYNLGR